MFKTRKKAKDDNSNPFEGYVADGLAAADFKAEAEAEAEVSVQSEPAPASEPLETSEQELPVQTKPPAKVSAPTPAPAPENPTAPATQSSPEIETEIETDSAPVAQGQAKPNPAPRPVAVKPPASVSPQTSGGVEPADPTQDQVDIAIKEAEAETELPKDELLQVGFTPPQISPAERLVTADKIEVVVTEAPATSPKPKTEPARPLGHAVPVLSADEERAAVVATHRELAELLGWAERDTNDYMNEIQLVIDDLNAKIDHLRTSFAQDTARLNEDARIAFKENIEKNITLLKDQINLEVAKKDLLKTRKEEFIDKIHEALKKYKVNPNRQG